MNMDDQEWKMGVVAKLSRIETLLEGQQVCNEKKASKSSVAINRKLILLQLSVVVGLAIKVLVA